MIINIEYIIQLFIINIVFRNNIQYDRIVKNMNYKILFNELLLIR